MEAPTLQEGQVVANVSRSVGLKEMKVTMLLGSAHPRQVKVGLEDTLSELARAAGVFDAESPGAEPELVCRGAKATKD